MASGTVKWFNTRKGYGFIVPDDGTQDVFVHISDVQVAGLAKLDEGQRLGYEVATNNDGRRKAVNLVKGE
jgi:CspA family cold shock protein